MGSEYCGTIMSGHGDVWGNTYHYLHDGKREQFKTTDKKKEKGIIHIYYMVHITIRVKEMKREGITSSIKDMGMIPSCMYMSTRFCVGTYYMENRI